jgi:hypothetical protein
VNHEHAWPLLDDLLDGNLAPDARAGVEAHITECAECSGQASMMRLLRQPEVARAARDLPELHPSADRLSAYALTPCELSAGDWEFVDRHVRSCGECRETVRLGRRAARWADGWWPGVRDFWSSLVSPREWMPAQQAGTRWRWLGPQQVLVPALAALVVLMAYPAYLGIVSVGGMYDMRRPAPTERTPVVAVPPPVGSEPTEVPTAPRPANLSEQSAAQVALLNRELDSLRSVLAREPSPAAFSGPVAGLVVDSRQFLEGLLGEREETPSGVKAARPSAAPRERIIVLKPGQEGIPVFVEVDLAAQGSDMLEREYLLEVRREPDDRLVWHTRARGKDIWLSGRQAIFLLIPAQDLEGGSFRLELTDVGLDRPLGAVRFAVQAPAKLSPSK